MIAPVYRVHWLKSKARQDRWAKEKTLLRNEMDWTVRFFQWQAERWRRNAEHEEGSEGHCCYARKQKSMWLKFADFARHQFNKVIVGTANG